MSVPAIAALEELSTSSPSSPSRKRDRSDGDDDDEESEQEVERSIRSSGDLGRSHGRSPNKRSRSDVNGAREVTPSPSPQMALVRYASVERSSPKPSASDSEVEASSEADPTLVFFKDYMALEYDDDDSYMPSDDDDDDDNEPDLLEFDVTEDEIVVDASTTSDKDSECRESNTQHELRKSLHFLVNEEGKGTWTWGTPRSSSPGLDIEDYLRCVEGLEDEPLSDEACATGGPSAPPLLLGYCRPLKRTRERLRPISDGGVEVYKYDEGPEYEARLARDAEIISEWKKLNAQRSRK
jgi:hypothetical protein